MVLVKLRDNEPIEEALRRFKRECERNGIMQEIKRREYFESPAIRKKRKAAEARRKLKRRMMRLLLLLLMANLSGVTEVKQRQKKVQ